MLGHPLSLVGRASLDFLEHHVWWWDVSLGISGLALDRKLLLVRSSHLRLLLHGLSFGHLEDLGLSLIEAVLVDFPGGWLLRCVAGVHLLVEGEVELTSSLLLLVCLLDCLLEFLGYFVLLVIFGYALNAGSLTEIRSYR